MSEDQEARLRRNAERITKLETLQEEGFKRNDETHSRLEHHILNTDYKLDKILTEIGAYRSMLKGVGFTLGFLGMFVGWLVHEWELLKGWLK